MSKPVGYYCSATQLDNLCERFGQELDLLDREQKLELRIVLTYFIWGQDQMGDSYTINDAWIDSLEQLSIEDNQINECLSILKGISVRDAESLLVALQAQCTQGNARLKTPIETTTHQLIELGVPATLALTASNIIHQIDNLRPRTADEQALINQVHGILVRGK
ncbi:hypothetical protein [Iningainema tapete]|uniref:Uncharacterized protein n=1 Tax=Iningainema tapete BLCC-T55 TaxID=2748662 RepID=A0A8J6XAP1_9CYAN|nr:hypothetical protein [Iningainema tapete]MBD2770964.1 hypothetical protein [Iningainema tapete BLCC-T55]